MSATIEVLGRGVELLLVPCMACDGSGDGNEVTRRCLTGFSPKHECKWCEGTGLMPMSETIYTLGQEGGF